ncbi:MAG: adenosylcobinamide-GDP ribazoletransferase [Armatimonadetes bacterium]|nr:adenosylcobinamide-GDP ribazoletransferase [Armatimonadota bacterium]
MGLLTAFRFLTVLPLPHREEEPGALGASAAFFPLVGLVLGLALAGLDVLLRKIWPPEVTSAVLLLALTALTGALHLDGFMDSCDGLFGSHDPARRMEIMKDSRVGSFGVLGVACLFLVKYAALLALPDSWRLGALALAPALGRWAMVLVIWGFPYARPQGTGRVFKEGVGLEQVAPATLTTVLAALFFLPKAAAPSLFVAALSAWLLARFICTRIPGLTGDSYGAVTETIEVVSLLTLVTCIGVGHG